MPSYVSEASKGILRESNILDLISRNFRSYTLYQNLRMKNEGVKKPSHKVVNKYIDIELSLVWDKEKREWKSKENNNNLSSDVRVKMEQEIEEKTEKEIEQEVGYEEHKTEEKKEHVLDKFDDESMVKKCIIETYHENEDTETEKEIEGFKEKIEDNISAEDISATLSILMDNKIVPIISRLVGDYDELKKEVRFIKEKMNDFNTQVLNKGQIDVKGQQNNNKGIYNELINFQISKSQKISISINEDIKDKVINYIRNKYNIEGNESKCIQLALTLFLNYVQET